MANYTSIAQILAEFQRRGGFSVGTQILGMAGGATTDPAAYPVTAFLGALFDMMQFDDEERTLSYVDGNGTTHTIPLGLAWSELTESEKTSIINKVVDDASAEVLDELNSYVRAEQLRVQAENARVLAENARAAAETARANAETARKEAETARVNAENARVQAETARATAETTRQSNETTRQSNEQTRQSQEQTRQQNEQTRQTQETARQTNTAAAITNANNATALANETAEHPTYFDEDLYAWVWDSATHKYNKTTVNAGAQLRVDYQYPTVAALNADTSEIPNGRLAVINSGNVEDPDNARFYIRQNGAWQFLCDLSGLQGATGKTPQIIIGTITAGNSKSDAAASFSPNGTDANGNPVQKLNLVLPCLGYDDLTDAQIAELQKPATDAITQANAARDAANAAASKADTATTQANAARDAANEAAGKANTATTQANAARDAANAAATSANNAADSANTEAARAQELANHPPKMGDNGNWWEWDLDTHQYVDTGVLAKGGVLYPTFYVGDDMQLRMRYQDVITAQMFSFDEETGILTFKAS